MKNAVILAFCGVAFAALATLPAAAETLMQPQTPAAAAAAADSNPGLATELADAQAAPVPLATAVDADPFAQAMVLDDADLAEFRGGESITVGNQTLKAITSGNVLNGDFTAGAITLSQGALSNFSGIGNFAINTGAQVSLQSGMNLVINIGQ